MSGILIIAVAMLLVLCFSGYLLTGFWFENLALRVIVGLLLGVGFAVLLVGIIFGGCLALTGGLNLH